jgi:murein DD-endopeptidase MepM/ murein hydrolase activator NlpD
LTFAEIQYGVLSGNKPFETDGATGQEISTWFRNTSQTLSEGFYEYYNGYGKTYFTLQNGEKIPTSAGNASTYALEKYFSMQMTNADEWNNLTPSIKNKFISTYESYFGSALQGKIQAAHPSLDDLGLLALPTLKLPWENADTWNYTGGPHNIDGSGNYPLSGIDYQPVGHSGCSPNIITDRWIVASAAGKTVDYQEYWLKLDHDQDGNVSTGWLTVYGHIANRIGDNQTVQMGQRLGNPSCFGGTATGVHLHFGIKFQNVWQPIDGTVISGWTIQNGSVAYHGYMSKTGMTQRESCYRSSTVWDCSNAAVTSDNSGGDNTPPDGEITSPNEGATITNRTVYLGGWAKIIREAEVSIMPISQPITTVPGIRLAQISLPRLSVLIGIYVIPESLMDR